MAGKTFPGLGDLEDEAPPVDPADAADSSENSRSDYSGPTVVDDAKVEQGLKKLRSLDAAAEPSTGIQQAIAGVLADPARATPPVPVPADLLMAEITMDPGRGTAIGRSVSGPVVGQQTTQPVDDRALRGTMFGHGVHLPDLEEARRAMLVETSKALAVVERGVPTTNEITVFQPGTYPQQSNIPRAHEPFPRASNRGHVPETPIALRTVVPRNQLIFRVALTGIGIVAIVVAALLWVRSNDDSDLNAHPAPAIPVSRPSKPGEAQPGEAQPGEAQPVQAQPVQAQPVQAQPIVARPSPPPPSPAAPVPPPAAVAPTPAAPPPEVAAPAEVKSPTPPSPAEPAARRSHGSSSRSERHHAAAASEAAAAGTPKGDEGAKTEKPDRPSRTKRPVEEDPDGTMAPTIE
jgi:hypothetical protein